jgi:hypothetical protein
MKLPTQFAGIIRSMSGTPSGLRLHPTFEGIGLKNGVLPNQFILGQRQLPFFGVTTCPSGQSLCCDGSNPPTCVCCARLASGTPGTSE